MFDPCYDRVEIGRLFTVFVLEPGIFYE